MEEPTPEQCQELTKAGFQCKSRSSKRDSHNPAFCWRHQNCDKQPVKHQKTPNKTNPIAAVPADVIQLVMLELPYKDLKSLCRTDRRAAKICNDELFWEKKAMLDFNLNLDVIPLAFPTWKKFYQYIYPIHNMLFTEDELNQFDKIQDIIQAQIIDNATLVDGVYYWNFDVSDSFDLALDVASDGNLESEFPMYISLPASLRGVNYNEDQGEQGYWFDRLISYKGYDLDGIGEGIFALPFPIYRDLYNYVAFKLNQPNLFDQMRIEDANLANNYVGLYVPVYSAFENYHGREGLLQELIIPAGQMSELDRYYDLTSSRRRDINKYKSKPQYEEERRAMEPKYTRRSINGINIKWSQDQIVSAIKKAINWNRGSGIKYIYYKRDDNTFFYFQPDPNGDLIQADINVIADDSDRIFYM